MQLSKLACPARPIACTTRRSALLSDAVPGISRLPFRFIDVDSSVDVCPPIGEMRHLPFQISASTHAYYPGLIGVGGQRLKGFPSTHTNPRCRAVTHAVRRTVRVLSNFQEGVYQPAAPIGTAISGAPPQSASGVPLLAPPPETPNPVFQSIETAIQRTFNSQQPGQRNDWREIEGSYVLFPPSSRQPEAVVHFLGAAFVGAAPSIAYRLFLEALANRNVLVSVKPWQ